MNTVWYTEEQLESLFINELAELALTLVCDYPTEFVNENSVNKWGVAGKIIDQLWYHRNEPWDIDIHHHEGVNVSFFKAGKSGKPNLVVDVFSGNAPRAIMIGAILAVQEETINS